MTVERLLATVPSSELTEWMAFYTLEPFGGPTEDYRAGVTSMVLQRIHGNRDTKIMMPPEFFPWNEVAKKKPELVGKTPEEISKAIAALLGRVD